MGPDASWLYTFKCGGQEIVIVGYAVFPTGIFRYPRWKLHPQRITMEQNFLGCAQQTFGIFPGIMLWPEDPASDNKTDQYSRFSGVRVIANCSGLPLVPDGDVVEKLIVMWFQDDHCIVPAPTVVPRLQQLPWRQLATEIDND